MIEINCIKKAGVILLSALASAGCAKKPAEPDVGELVFTKTCKVCHASGLNGAPIYGNAKMWSSRITQGLPTLIEHATNGYGLMPAKGGNTDLSDTEVAAAVRHMVGKVQ